MVARSRRGTAPTEQCSPGGNAASTPQSGDDVEVRYSTDQFWNQYSRIGTIKPFATIHGMEAYLVTDPGESRIGDKPGSAPPPSAVRLEGDGVEITIGSLDAHPSTEKLRRIAEAMQLTHTPTDPATWFDAATSIP